MIDLLGLKRRALGHYLRKKDSEAPDTSKVNEAALISARTSQDALNWFKDEYARTAGDRASTTARNNQIADAQLAAMNFSTQEAKDLSQRNRSIYQPLEDQIVADAKAYDTPERRTAAADTARATVENSFGSTQDSVNRAIGRTGGTLGGRAAALMADNALAKAKASAGATTQAVNNVEQQGYARRMDAAGLGKGIIGSQATMQQIAAQNGAGAVNAGGAALGAANSGAGLMSSGFSSALQGNQISGNLYSQAAGLSRTQDGSGSALGGIGGLFQGIGSLFGTSDENAKEDIKEIPDEEALEKVTQLDNKSWKYKPGIEDGGADSHAGPMAQQVQEVMGDEMAPEGKMVDLVGMQEMNTKAIQALTTEVEQLASMIEQMIGAPQQ